VGLRAEPSEIVVESGQAVSLTVTPLDAAGNPVTAPLRIAGPRSGVRITRRGSSALERDVTGRAAGRYEIVVSVVLRPDAEGEPATLRIPVTVTWPAVTRIEISAEPGRLYAGTTLRHSAAAFHSDGSSRPEARFTWSSSDADIATVDRFGQVTARVAGDVAISAELEGTKAERRYTVRPFGAVRLSISGEVEQARIGDVLTFSAVASDQNGQDVVDVPVTWAYTFVPDDSINAPGAAAHVLDGKFVAEVPGQYTVIAMAGQLSARTSVDVRPRNVVREVELVGHGQVSQVHTSDLWVFEGTDGRDYAITGTWGGDGYAYTWDVTDPANIVRTDSVQVDARTVNDVKVAPSARYAAISREGASNRRNGVVILDLSNPAHPTVASVFDDGLTGGVHNMFATDDYLFALSGGDKYVILDVRDVRNPTYVSEYNHPNSRIHDVWVHDGLAYSSEWGTGVVIVDVGNGKWGGSIENPVFVTNVPYPVGATHAAFPYLQESTGKFYLFLGDEIMGRRNQAFSSGVEFDRYDPATGRGGRPSGNMGYIHIIDFTDPEAPRDVARYHVEEFGTHNMWIEDDVLYQAYYEGGLRVVDVSGELMGNLAEQGREIAIYKPYDPAGFIANAPMVWGAQPHKGHVFFSDWNTGLWSVKVKPKERPTS
jgi:hypothetical protein